MSGANPNGPLVYLIKDKLETIKRLYRAVRLAADC